MALPKVVDQYLRHHHLTAKEVEHSPVFTARELAKVEHVPETMVAKVVFFFCDTQLVMGVLPADRHLNLHLARRGLKARRIRLATENEIARHISTLQLGSIPPFGSMFGLPVVMDAPLAANDTIEVPAGMQTESLKLPLRDYLREEAPQILPLSKHPMHFHQRQTERLPEWF